MSKYNEYAKKLDAAFKKASAKQKEACDAYKAAEQARKKDPDNDAVITEYKQAKKTMDTAQKSAWDEFHKEKDSLTRQLQEDLRKAQLADPAEVDANTIALLNSGILKYQDLAGLAEKYSNSPTMRRLIGQKAEGLAENTRDPGERTALNVLAHNCKIQKIPQELNTWNSLTSAADHYSGYSSATRNPELICALNNHWNDADVQATIENF